MKLTNFIGNEKVIDRLSKLMESGRFPHALIIEGEEGIGKKTLAKDIACALVCRGNDKPCGECSQCKKAIGAIHPDISEPIHFTLIQSEILLTMLTFSQTRLIIRYTYWLMRIV